MFALALAMHASVAHAACHMLAWSFFCTLVYDKYMLCELFGRPVS